MAVAAGTAVVTAVAMVAVAAVSVADQRPAPRTEPADSGLFLFKRAWQSVAHEQGHQRVGTHLAAPMTMHGGVKRGPFRQGVGRVEKLTRPKNARATVL